MSLKNGSAKSLKAQMFSIMTRETFAEKKRKLEGAIFIIKRIKRKLGKRKRFFIRKDKTRNNLRKSKKLIKNALTFLAGADIKMPIKIEDCNRDV